MTGLRRFQIACVHMSCTVIVGALTRVKAAPRSQINLVKTRIISDTIISLKTDWISKILPSPESPLVTDQIDMQFVEFSYELQTYMRKPK